MVNLAYVLNKIKDFFKPNDKKCSVVYYTDFVKLVKDVKDHCKFVYNLSGVRYRKRRLIFCIERDEYVGFKCAETCKEWLCLKKDFEKCYKGILYILIVQL